MRAPSDASRRRYRTHSQPAGHATGMVAVGVKLEEALGVKVDVGIPASLRQRLRDEVLAEAVPL